MNKILALLLLLGAIGGFGMAGKHTPHQVQDQSWTGAPVGAVRTIYVRSGERIFYFGFGLACLIGSAYFVFRIRGEDTRR